MSVTCTLNHMIFIIMYMQSLFLCIEDILFAMHHLTSRNCVGADKLEWQFALFSIHPCMRACAKMSNFDLFLNQSLSVNL